MGQGVPGIRLQALMEHSLLAAKGQRGFYNGITRQEREAGEPELGNICSNDFTPAFARLGQVILGK